MVLTDSLLLDISSSGEIVFYVDWVSGGGSSCGRRAGELQPVGTFTVVPAIMVCQEGITPQPRATQPGY